MTSQRRPPARSWRARRLLARYPSEPCGRSVLKICSKASRLIACRAEAERKRKRPSLRAGERPLGHRALCRHDCLATRPGRRAFLLDVGHSNARGGHANGVRQVTPTDGQAETRDARLRPSANPPDLHRRRRLGRPCRAQQIAGNSERNEVLLSPLIAHEPIGDTTRRRTERRFGPGQRSDGIHQQQRRRARDGGFADAVKVYKDSLDEGRWRSPQRRSGAPDLSLRAEGKNRDGDGIPNR